MKAPKFFGNPLLPFLLYGWGLACSFILTSLLICIYVGCVNLLVRHSILLGN